MTETILDRILQKKRDEVEQMKKDACVTDNSINKKAPSLHQTLLTTEHLSVIAEIKRASPSKGDINVGMEPNEQGALYESSGASAISVLTDTPFFKGTIDDLRDVRAEVSIPILCKDFVIDEVQIDRAKQAGANIILLIAAALPVQRLKDLYRYAVDLNLEVLFEVHNEDELDVAFDVGANIIGINNRDLKTFNVDLSVTERLAANITDPNTAIISESGIKHQSDADRVARAGAHGILVGETLMRSKDVKGVLNQLKVSQ
ncbi:indole-3-glycerol phosphate synthase TrpC [Alkalibacillus aidingensis]|uniref:indole-3-glycerol phosphate synthase TrpC n=1 Tax=Alkalibacillus aidingensis TaxID=2747607 RepID=UPI001661390F|nr:indole-3-glycerol phosphate synthase TrpC [Alkalibacillus aidingensis]